MYCPFELVHLGGTVAMNVIFRQCKCSDMRPNALIDQACYSGIVATSPVVLH